MTLNRIRNKLKKLLSEQNSDEEKELEVPSFVSDEEEEDEVTPDDNVIDPENDKSGAAQADYGAGIYADTTDDAIKEPSDDKETKQGKINKERKYTMDPGVIGKKRERQSQELDKKIEKGDYHPAVDLFTVSNDELIDEIEKRFMSKWTNENLIKEPKEKIVDELKKMTIEKLNEQEKISQNLVDSVKKYNYYIAGPPTNRDAFNYVISKDTEALGGDTAKGKFGAGGAGGNINDQFLALAVPDNLKTSEEMIEAVKSSLMDAVRTPQHIIHNFVGTDKTPIPEYQTDEDALKKLFTLSQTVQDLPKFKNKFQITKGIEKAKNEIESMGLADAFIGKKKIPVTKYIDYLNNKIENAIQTLKENNMFDLKNFVKSKEEIKPEQTDQSDETVMSAKDRVDKFYNWFKNNKYKGIFIRGKEHLERIFDLMKQSEINQAIINGILAKFDKLKNLEPEQVIPEKDDFLVIMTDEEYKKLMNDLQKQKLAENEQKPIRQRKLSKKASLKEAWKFNQEKIKKTHLDKFENQKTDMPDLHLGGLS